MYDIGRIKDLYTMLGSKYFIKKMIAHILPIISIKNTRVRSMIYEESCYKKLRKYLDYNSIDLNISCADGEQRYNIWILWLQGEENMPPIVKICYESVRKYCKEYKINLVTSENIHNYIVLPDYIVKKYQSGYIPNAIYSDIIRVSLLAEYGGIWLDATVYLTDFLPDYITDSELFFYQRSKLEYSPKLMSNWLLATRYPNNPVMCLFRNAMYNYWKYEKHAMAYNIFHLFGDVMCENEVICRVWDNIPYVCNMNPHVLQFSLSETYCKEKWELICETSSVHKLYWRIKMDDFRENCILKKICNINEGIEND